MIKTVAITGSEGFVGSHLSNVLLANNYNVIRLDIKNGFDLLSTNSFNTHPAFDLIIHLAAKVFVPDSFDNPADFLSFNYTTTLNALEIARKYSAKFIYMSSYIYGTPEYLPIDENHPIKPHNPYAFSKLNGENLTKCYNVNYNIPALILRPFNLYGPNQAEAFLISKIVAQALSGKIILNDPRPKRDFLHISDFVALIQKILEKNFDDFGIYNVGSGVSYSVSEIVGIVNSLFQNTLHVEYSNQVRPNEVLNTVANIEKINKTFDWVPAMTLYDGLSNIIN
jgi:nucleoside-diphosphate-sugar epimerase